MEGGGEDMRAYHLAMALIIFNLSIPIVSAFGITPSAGGTGENIASEYGGVSITDWGGFFSVGLPMFAAGVVASIVGLKMNMGAVIFAVVFTVSTIPFAATLAAWKLASSVTTLITVALTFTFVFAFIQLSSVPTETD